MGGDAISALESLGYTEREASFLYVAAMHSGYFLRRQFNCFVERKNGSIAQSFIDKARLAGHLEIIDYGQGKYVYHLIDKSIYRLLGHADSHNRRVKGDGEIRLHLMALDYVIESEGEHFLEHPEGKINFFLRARQVPSSLLHSSRWRDSGYPISITDREHPVSSVVRFAFMDEGLLSTKKFTRFLSELGPLMLAVGAFEVIYTAVSSTNFSAARAAFRRVFEVPVAARQQIFTGARSPSRSDSFALRPLQASFTTLLFHFNYPPLLRYEPRGFMPESVHRSPASSKIA
jgi:hypothetical protein